uniref:Uncharacterized protein n=1 Tax=Anguilla anguilla TaxID=7936 RepID=A0A0E9UL10_ANGAN
MTLFFILIFFFWLVSQASPDWQEWHSW